MDDSLEKFETELEFVQCLASPSYVHFLAQNRYFDDPRFVRYLRYLLYWCRPEYARYIVFPHALYFLRMLQKEEFREAMKKPDFYMFVHQQQGYFWQFNKTMTERKEVEGGGNL